MERHGNKLVKVTTVGLDVARLSKKGNSTVIFLAAAAQNLPAEAPANPRANQTSPSKRRKKIHIDRELSDQFKSRAYQQQRELSDCLEEALASWTKTAKRPGGRSVASPTESSGSGNLAFFRVSPSIWASFKARAAEMSYGCSEGVAMALRAWLVKSSQHSSRR